MAAHTKEQRAFIIRRLAFYCPVPIILADFTRNWKDTACLEQDVIACDPAKVLLGPDEHALFTKARAEAADESPEFAAKRARLHAMQWIAECYANSGRLAEALKTLAQIAEETGDGGKGGTDSGGSVPPVGRITRTIVDPAPAAE